MGGIIFYKYIKKLLDNEFVRVIFILLPPLVLFVKILLNNPVFLSDDFEHLQLVSGNSYIKIFQLAMSPAGIWVGHRVVLGFWLFKAIFDIWGSNIIPYVTVIFILNSINILLLYNFLKKLLYAKTSALFAFIFGFFYLSWISNIHELLAALFILLNLMFFMKWIESSKKKYFCYSVVFYVLALFSKEISFLAFFPMLGIYLLNNKKNLKPKHSLAILATIFGTYTIFYASGFLKYFNGSSGGYSMGFSLTGLFSNLDFYVRQIFSVGAFSWLLMFLIIFLLFYFKNYVGLLFSLSYLLFIFPILFFVAHRAPYYNYIPLVFLLTGIGALFQDVLKKFPKTNNKILILGLILFIIGVFGIDRKLMDSCFLILFPWR